MRRFLGLAWLPVPDVSDFTADVAGKSFGRASFLASAVVTFDLALAPLFSDIAPDADVRFSVMVASIDD